MPLQNSKGNHFGSGPWDGKILRFSIEIVVYLHGYCGSITGSYWYPIDVRWFQFKIAVIMFKALMTQQLHYLSELIQIHVPHRHLRSADAECLAVPRTKLKLINRAFSHTAPTIWNRLAVCRSALSTVTLSQFKHLVKSELYNRAFDNI